jgi:putative transposase
VRPRSLPGSIAAPYRHANKLPYQVERTILGLKKEYSGWGATKIRDKIIRAFPMIKPPATSTVHAVLDRHGLVKRRKRRRHKACGTELTSAHEVICTRASATREVLSKNRTTRLPFLH